MDGWNTMDVMDTACFFGCCLYHHVIWESSFVDQQRCSLAGRNQRVARPGIARVHQLPAVLVYDDCTYGRLAVGYVDAFYGNKPCFLQQLWAVVVSLVQRAVPDNRVVQLLRHCSGVVCKPSLELAGSDDEQRVSGCCFCPKQRVPLLQYLHDTKMVVGVNVRDVHAL